MTVSRVVNGESNVREETRARVTESIEALRYAPNLAARSLASAATMRVALLCTDQDRPYLSDLLVGGLEQCRLSGCQFLIERCEGAEADRQVLNRLTGGAADGLVLSPALCGSATFLEATGETGVPVVGVAGAAFGSRVSIVGIPEFDAARDMTRHLIALGHRDIGFVTGDPKRASSNERYRGFQAAMGEAGIEVPERRVAEGGLTYRSGVEAGERLLADDNPPSAIFASNDEAAAGVVSAAHRRGLEVPGDLTVVGFGDTPLASAVWPQLTTVRRPIGDMARVAVSLLLEIARRRRAGLEDEVEHKVFDYALMVRGSSGPPPVRREIPSP